jgi:Protein of unknown function (DUF3866)
MLKLRRATVLEADPPSAEGPGGEQRLTIALDGGEPAPPRAAIADTSLIGPCRAGDELVVNVEAQDLGLGSGGFDVVHVNLTRGLEAPGAEGRDVMKLNYTSLQHTVSPVERDGELQVPLGRPVAVLALHGQLAAVAWAFARRIPGGRLGYVQTAGGALPGGHSRTVAALREGGLLAGHLTAGAAFGGEHEAVTLAGALHHGFVELGWDAAVCGPGPGIVGSASRLGHGGMVALDSAHVALALGCPTLLVARMSSRDERARHRGISHHTITVLDLLLEPVSVALPAGVRSPVGSELRAGLGAGFGEAAASRPGLPLEADRPARITRHDWRRAEVDLPAFAISGVCGETMGRGLTEDPVFFGAALAGGTALGELAEAATACGEEAVGAGETQGDGEERPSVAGDAHRNGAERPSVAEDGGSEAA